MSDLAINVVARSNTAAVMGGAAKDIGRVEAAAKSAGASLKNIGNGLSSVGAGLTAGVTLPLVALGAAAISAGNKLNEGMANIASLGVASDHVKQLKSDIQGMQIEFGKSADDLTAGAYQIVSAFGDTNDTTKILAINTKLATAGLSTTAEAIALTSAVTKGYNDTSVAAIQHTSDLGLKVVELGQTTLPELAASVGMVTSMSNGLGIKQEELFAGASALTGVIGTASSVFTGQRGAMQSLMAPTESMTKLMKAHGFVNGEAMIKSLGWAKSLELITSTAKKANVPLQQFIGSIEGQNYAVALTGSQLKKYNSDLEAMGNVTGKTDAAFDAQTKGVNAAGFAMEQAKQKLQVFLERISDGIGPALLAFTNLLDPVVNKLLDLSDKFAKLDPTTQTWIVGIAAAAAAIGPLLFAVGKVTSAIGFALPFIAAIGSALSGLLLPLGLLYVAYKLNLFGLQNFVDKGLSRVRAAAPSVGGALRELIAQVTGFGVNTYDTTENIQRFVTALTGSEQSGQRAGDMIANLGQKIYAAQIAFKDAGGGVASYAAAFNTLTDIDLSPLAGKALAEIAKIKTAFSDVFSGDVSFSQFVGKLSAALSGIPDMVRTMFAGTDFGALKTEVVSALGLDKITFDFTGVKGKVGEAIGNALSSVDWSTITADFKKLPLWVSQKLSLIDWSTITTTFSTLQAWVSTKFSTIDWSLITTDFSTLTAWVSTKLGAINFSTITADFTSLKTWVSSKLGGLDFSTLTTTFSGITTIAQNLNTSLQGLTGASGGLTQLQNLITGTIQGVVDSIRSIDANQVASVGLSFSGALTSVLDVFTTLSNLGNDNVGKATASISSLVQSILGLATSFTTGLGATAISASAGKFVASFVDEITKVLGNADLPGIAGAASGFLSAITGQFATAMKGDAPGIIGTSFGGLAAEIITQIGATLGQADFGKNIGKSLTNTAEGFGVAANSIAQGIVDQLTQVDWNQFGAQIHTVAEGIFSQFYKKLQENLAAGEKEQGFRRETGKPVYRGSYGQPLSEEASKTADSLAKIPPAVSDFLKGLVWGRKEIGPDMGLGNPAIQNQLQNFLSKPITVATATVDANTVTWPSNLPLPNASDNSIRTSNDFSTALSELNAISAKVTAIPPFAWPPMPSVEIPPVVVPPIPPVTVPPIPPVQVNPIPPIQVPQPFWVGSLLNWHPTVSVQGPVQGAQTFFRGFASGTKFAPGGWAWVGENGAELMRVPPGAQIMSHSKSMETIGQLATGNYSGGPYLGAPFAPPLSIGAPQLAPINEHLKTIAKATTTTAVLSQTQLRANLMRASIGNPTEAERERRAKASLGDLTAVERERRARAGGALNNNASARTLENVQKAGLEIARTFQGSIDDLKSALQSVPGLFHTSDVTQKQLDMAALGVPQDFADNWIRHLTDEVVNGVQWNDADIKDAALRAGIDPSLPGKAILEMVKDQWNDQSFFADGKNTDLINMDAVKAALAQQQAQASGKNALMALFGIDTASATQQAAVLGGQARTGLIQGLTGAVGTGKAGAAGGQPVDMLSGLLSSASITPEALAPLASQFMSAWATALAPKKDKDGKNIGADFGAPIVAAIGTSLTEGLKTIGDTVDFVGGISTAINTQLLTTGAIDSLKATGGAIAKILKAGIDEYFKDADIAAAVGSGVKSAASTTTATANPVSDKAIGSYSWQGGRVRVGETGPEVLDIPPRTRIYGRGETAAMGGDTHVTNHWHVTVANDIDVRSLAYQVLDMVKRKGK